MHFHSKSQQRSLLQETLEEEYRGKNYPPIVISRSVIGTGIRPIKQNIEPRNSPSFHRHLMYCSGGNSDPWGKDELFNK